MSTNDLMLDVGQANELKLAFRREGFTNDEIKKLCEGSILAGVKNVLIGRSEIKSIDHVIDCDVAPNLPNKSWEVEEHKKGGLWKWDEKDVILHLSETQKRGETIGGNDLRKELENERVLNANVLDYLLGHPELIPETWKKDEKGNTRYVFFWGTIYRDPGGDLGVRCLDWRGDSWRWIWFWLWSGWSDRAPAALRASSSISPPIFIGGVLF
jgi:hypothetical protein